MKSITLTQLNYIVAVFQTRNFSSAAKNCFISQPTLSMQIQKLEEDLGVTLFDCSKKPVEPTDGKVLAYLFPDHPLLSFSTISEKDLSLDDIWLLNEGHCFRDQAIEICKKTRGKNVRRKNLIFESGNLETLKRLVDQKFGYTLLP